MNAKRLVPLALTLLLLLPAAAVRADMAPTQTSVVINGVPLWDYTYLDSATGHVLVPADSLAQAIGAQYSDGGSSVSFAGPGSSLSVEVKSGGAVRQGSQTLVPVRSVIEGLGGTVQWHDGLVLAQINALNRSQTYTVTVPGDYFQPFALLVNAGDTVNFNNTDSEVHTVVTLDGAPAPVQLTLAGGARASYRFDQPGIYHYYCTVHSSLDSDGLVKAVKDVDQFPAAMEGWVLVAGKGQSLPGAATVTMPGDLFTPGALMVRTGATVTFDNKDSDVHTVVTIPGAPADIQLALKGGEKATYTFSKPGLYIYYCSVHAAYDPTSGQVKAAAGTDVFPAAMEGIIAVVG